MPSTSVVRDRMTPHETDEFAGPGRLPRIPVRLVEQLTRVNSWRALRDLALNSTVIVVAACFAETVINPLTYLLAVILIGVRLHALAVLMHDATHYRLFGDRRMNEFAGELLAWLFLFTLHGYRKNHFAHHRHLNTEDDPDWARKKDDPYFAMPQDSKRVAVLLLKGICGARFFTEARNIARAKGLQRVPRGLKIRRSLFYAAVLASVAYWGLWPVLFKYWVVPLMTSLAVILYVRSLAEHHGGTMIWDGDMLSGSRHLDARWWEKFLLAPHNVHYHVDHHLYPSVPYYNLPRLHMALLAQPEYVARAHITDGYFTGLRRECVRPVGVA
jgi:fatty acid desaturase